MHDFLTNYKFHKQYNYIRNWNLVSSTTLYRVDSMIESHAVKSIKVRLFDYWLDDLYCYANNQTFYITMKKKNNKKLNIRKFSPYELGIFHNKSIMLDHKHISLPIFNQYITNDCLVLYSIPSVKSLQKAQIKLTPKDFKNKMIYLCHNEFKMNRILESLKQFPNME